MFTVDGSLVEQACLLKPARETFDQGRSLTSRSPTNVELHTTCQGATDAHGLGAEHHKKKIADQAAGHVEAHLMAFPGWINLRGLRLATSGPSRDKLMERS